MTEGEGQSRTDGSETRFTGLAGVERGHDATCNKNARGNERERESRPFLAGANARKKRHMERVKRGIGGSFTFARDEERESERERRVVARERRKRDEEREREDKW